MRLLDLFCCEGGAAVDLVRGDSYIPHQLTDADRAVLDAAEAWYGHACGATRTGHPTVDNLIAAVRARREAQP